MAPDPAWLTYPLLHCTASFLALTWIALILRLGVRQFIVKKLFWDDYVLVLAAAMYTAFLGCLLEVTQIELHGGISTIDDIKKLIEYLSAVNSTYIVTTIILRIALAIFFLRILDQKWQRILIWSFVITYTIFATAWWFIDMFRCGNPSHPLQQISGPCYFHWDVIGPLTYAHSAFNAVADWVFAITPCFTIWRTQLPLRERVTVLSLCMMAMIGSACSVVRLGYLHYLSGDALTILKTAPRLGMLSEAELGLGIIAMCLAALRPLWKLIKGKARGSGKESDEATTALRTFKEAGDIKMETTFAVVEGV